MFDNLTTNGEMAFVPFGTRCKRPHDALDLFRKRFAASGQVSRAPKDSAKIGTMLWNLAQAVAIMRSIAVER